MDSLKIVADGKNDKDKAQARGKLFEKISAEVLKCHGYEIDEARPNVTHAGMEIDIEGRARLADTPLYAECKCYSADVDSPKLQAFYGKYMTRWLKDNKCHGLFLAIPAVNSHAKGFYVENCEGNSQITVRLLQEPEVLDAIINGDIVVSPENFELYVSQGYGMPGDRVLVCSDKGFFWMQYVVPRGSGMAKSILFFDSQGHPISDMDTVSYLLDHLPEANQFEIVTPHTESILRSHTQGEQVDDVVEVRGSSACFEYQFPAAPEFFVGRKNLLDNVDDFAGRVVQKKTSSRGILFEANSGWGKSSLVLATLDRLNQQGHYTVALDLRAASTSQFLLRAVEHILDKFDDFHGQLTTRPVLGGFDGAVKALVDIGRCLEPIDKILFIFFDQFENVFHLLDLLTRIATLCLKVADAGTNIVLGFSWKTDLVGLTREFPYRYRDTIIDSCEVFHLPPFSEIETNALLERLAHELHTKLRKDLQFLLSEFSQGYPWLLKKLCAHVKNQRKIGVAQAEMVRGLLNVEQLFLEDIQGLTPEQAEVLKRTAGLAPVSIGDLSEEINPQVIQSLVDRRLIVKVGNKYDIYWDIFRDYLNTGKLPIEEIYLLRARVYSITKALSILQKSGPTLGIDSFKEKAMLSDGAFLNMARDLRLLQFAMISDNKITLQLPDSPDEKALLANIRNHLRDRLPRNRCVHHVLKVLRDREDVTIAELATILQEEFPYISAVRKTWETYARVLATWLDLCDLAVLDESKSQLSKYEVGTQIRERSLFFARRRSGVTVPLVHFAPVIQVATRIITAVKQNEIVDWSGIRRSTVYKALSMLEEMKLISRRSQTIYVTNDCFTFALNADFRVDFARSAVSAWPVFSALINILKEHEAMRLSHKKLAELLVDRCSLDWKTSTATTNAKIMLDWARHLGLAPGEYAYSNRGQFSIAEPQKNMPLFDALTEEINASSKNSKQGD